MEKTDRFFAFLAFAVLLTFGPSCGLNTSTTSRSDDGGNNTDGDNNDSADSGGDNDNQCSLTESVPVSALRFPGKIYPTTWTCTNESSTISGTVGADWPADTPTYGHYAFLSSDRYGYSFMSNADEYFDLETGIFHTTTWNGSGILTAETVVPPEVGGDATKYLKKIYATLVNDHAMLYWQSPRCVACANSAYLSRFLTDAADRYEFTDQYLIPHERLYFGGSLHYTSLVYIEGNGYGAGRRFASGLGAANNISNKKPAASDHYGLTVTTGLNSLELDLETGDLLDSSTFYAPTDAGYLDKLKKMRTALAEDMIDRPIDNGEDWYFNSAVFKDARDYLQYVIDRNAAPGP